MRHAVSFTTLTDFTKLLLPAYTSEPIAGANGATFSTVLGGYTTADTTIFALRASAHRSHRTDNRTQHVTIFAP